MAYLTFESSEANLQIAVGTGPGRDPNSVRLDLALTSSSWLRLADGLGEISEREGSELRTDFPEGWTLFWKLRAGESRFFVAHPETDQWVGTLAISSDHLATLRSRMKGGVEGELSASHPKSRMNNLEVTLRVKSP